MLRIIQNDVTQAFYALTTLLGLFTELIVSAALIVTLLVINPVITIGIAAILIVALLLILKVVRPALAKAGKKNQKSAAGLNKWMVQSIQGIKEVKVMQKEDFFEDQFAENGHIYADTTRKSAVMGQIPRFYLEATMMASLFIMMAFMIGNGVNLVSLIPTLSAIAMAAVRLLPSVNRISGAFADLAFREPMLDKLIENMTGSTMLL